MSPYLLATSNYNSNKLRTPTQMPKPILRNSQASMPQTAAAPIDNSISTDSDDELKEIRSALIPQESNEEEEEEMGTGSAHNNGSYGREAERRALLPHGLWKNPPWAAERRPVLLLSRPPGPTKEGVHQGATVKNSMWMNGTN